MKNTLLLFLLFFTVSLKSQIDLSTDVSQIGIYPNIKVTYPLYDKIIVGGSYGYNVSNYNLRDRYNLVLGIKIDEWVQMEFDFGVYEVNPISEIITNPILWENYGSKLPYVGKQYYSYNAALGLKYNFYNCTNVFASFQVAWPGFIKAGLGIRLRPYKQLTVWDRQW